MYIGIRIIYIILYPYIRKLDTQLATCIDDHILQNKISPTAKRFVEISWYIAINSHHQDIVLSHTYHIHYLLSITFL